MRANLRHPPSTCMLLGNTAPSSVEHRFPSLSPLIRRAAVVSESASTDNRTPKLCHAKLTTIGGWKVSRCVTIVLGVGRITALGTWATGRSLKYFRGGAAVRRSHGAKHQLEHVGYPHPKGG